MPHWEFLLSLFLSGLVGGLFGFCLGVSLSLSDRPEWVSEDEDEEDRDPPEGLGIS